MNPQTIRTWKEDPALRALMFSGLMLILYVLSFECQAVLEAKDKVKELETLTTEVEKIVKNGCFIAGCASALVGTFYAVASQSIKIAASSGIISLIAFRAHSFFSSSLII
jgi:hypothetical protein